MAAHSSPQGCIIIHHVTCSSAQHAGQAALLKFRLPFDERLETLEYADGPITLPVWGGRFSTETRLLVTDPVGCMCSGACCIILLQLSSRVYSRADYDDALHCFQTVTRSSYFPHDIVGDGIGLCFVFAQT